jgi:vitamin B12 transporter
MHVLPFRTFVPRSSIVSRTGRARHAYAPLLLIMLALAQPASAQTTLTGVVVDQLGGAIAGASVEVRTSTAALPQRTTTDVGGSFSVSDLSPGGYEVTVRHDLFETAVTVVDVKDNGAPTLRVTLAVAGVIESMVVTGRRSETRLSETPQKIEVIAARDIERSVAADLTDVLKKNAGVDVVQYSGVLSGIGIRGFRPEISGINKRSLLLIDGRPSGVTNLATLLLDDVDHVEVLKGPASAVYGASAMGGVVNVITRQSRGPVRAGARVAFGSFNATELAARLGGSVNRRIDFDVTGSAFKQRDDYRMGDGVVRPATTYETYDGSARLGADLAAAWRLDGRVNAYRGRDINTPGDVFSGTSSQGRKNLERASEDVRLSGQMRRHLLSATVYNAHEEGHTTNISTTNPLDQPFLPFLTFENELGWRGAQVKDVWSWARAHSLIVGIDYEQVTSHSQSYTRTGARQAPFSADNRKHTVGVYAENTMNVRGGRTILSAGGRVDRIAVETLETPFKTNFMPSTTEFTVFNPSVGIKQEIVPGLRAHATAGRAFVPADASALTGFTTNVVGGRTQINQGNPDLEPERSTSFDAGLEWFSPVTHVDVTYFQTTVNDRVVSNVVISNPAPPDPIVLTAINTLAAHIYGMDVEIERRFNAHLSAFSNITHYFSRKEELPSTGERNILNVATNTVRVGVDLDFGRLSTRLSGRFVQGRQDQDFNVAGSPVVDYPSFTVVDLSATYRFHPQHAALLTVNNLFDTYYYEKKGFPLAGTAITLKYRLGL